MVLLIFAGMAGGAFTFVALLSHDWLMALVAAPFGGSAATLVAALIIASRRSAGAHVTKSGGSETHAVAPLSKTAGAAMSRSNS